MLFPLLFAWHPNNRRQKVRVFVGYAFFLRFNSFSHSFCWFCPVHASATFDVESCSAQTWRWILKETMTSNRNPAIPPCLCGSADASHHLPTTQANPKKGSQESNEVPVFRRKRGRPPKKAKPINPTESCMPPPPPPPPQIPPNLLLQQEELWRQMKQNQMVPGAMQQTQQPQHRPTVKTQQLHPCPTEKAQ